MKRITLTLALIFLTHVVIGSREKADLAFRWGQNGHRIVAQICYDNLSPKVAKAIDGLLVDEYLTQVATWPDFIRSEKGWNFTQNWHFITIDPGKTVQEVVDEAAKKPGVDNVIEGIELMRSILEDDPTATKLLEDSMAANSVKPLLNSTKATALAFLVHFIGDIHQPMHVGKNKDLGGNKIYVMFFGEEAKLHSVWDSGIIDQEKLSFTEFADFVNKHTASQKAAWESHSTITWAEESVKLREAIYNTLYNNTSRVNNLPDFSYQYQHDFLPKVEERLGAAGYRAAYIVNQIFK